MSDDEDAPQVISSDIGPWALVPAWVRDALRADTGKVDVMGLAVFCLLAERADRSGERHDYRSVSTMASDLGVDPGTIRRALVRLRDVGAVSWVQRVRPDGSKSTNDYTVSFARLARMGAGTIAQQRADPHRAPVRALTPTSISTPIKDGGTGAHGGAAEADKPTLLAGVAEAKAAALAVRAKRGQ